MIPSFPLAFHLPSKHRPLPPPQHSPAPCLILSALLSLLLSQPAMAAPCQHELRGLQCWAVLPNCTVTEERPTPSLQLLNMAKGETSTGLDTYQCWRTAGYLLVSSARPWAKCFTHIIYLILTSVPGDRFYSIRFAAGWAAAGRRLLSNLDMAALLQVGRAGSGHSHGLGARALHSAPSSPPAVFPSCC